MNEENLNPEGLKPEENNDAYMPKESTSNMNENSTNIPQESQGTHYGFERKNDDLIWVAQKVNQVRAELKKFIIGQEQMVELLMTGIFCNGHVLLEGVPGVAKTLSSKVLAKALAIDFSRIQFTPDLMPSDVIGTSVFNMKETTFNFKKVLFLVTLY